MALYTTTSSFTRSFDASFSFSFFLQAVCLRYVQVGSGSVDISSGLNLLEPVRGFLQGCRQNLGEGGGVYISHNKDNTQVVY